LKHNPYSIEEVVKVLKELDKLIFQNLIVESPLAETKSPLLPGIRLNA
jgi:hypothetical protein